MRRPTGIDWEQTSYWRHQQKKVNAERPLDDMNNPQYSAMCGDMVDGNSE